MVMKMRPFEILKLIRDGVVTHVSDLHDNSNSLLYVHIGRFLRALERLGWIELSADGRIKAKAAIFEAQKALGLSLTQLAPYTEDSVVANPFFGYPQTPSEPADLFVMMPFADRLRSIYRTHIRSVADRLGITVTRGDDFFAANSVISDVWNAIANAKLLIADCTGRNPNVFYELGIAHTLGKSVILIAQDAGDVPFDVQHIRTIFYSSTPQGMRELEAALETALRRELAKPRTLADALALPRRRGTAPSN